MFCRICKSHVFIVSQSVDLCECSADSVNRTFLIAKKCECHEDSAFPKSILEAVVHPMGLRGKGRQDQRQISSCLVHETGRQDPRKTLSRDGAKIIGRIDDLDWFWSNSEQIVGGSTAAGIQTLGAQF